jgi:hypothetical protein
MERIRGLEVIIKMYIKDIVFKAVDWFHVAHYRVP